MTDLLLAKQKYDPSFIDCVMGEPYLIKDNLYYILNMKSLIPDISNGNVFEYTAPAGYEPLVKFLEDKHQAPVIISSGAKQAIGSIFYSLKCNGIKSIHLDNPWWSLFPSLIDMHGLYKSNLFGGQNSAYLLVNPNNPDGSIKSEEEIKYLQQDCKELNIPLIHDSAYYNYNYVPYYHSLDPIGDVQVFTCSKLFGLSQLRIGYSVFHNTELYNKALQYMEHMTVGTSVLSQMFAFNIFEYFNRNPHLEKFFNERCFSQLSKNRKIANQISSDIITDPNENGMFLWAKCKNPQKFITAKVAVADGLHFGKPGYIRMNLALKQNVIEEIVSRLNETI